MTYSERIPGSSSMPIVNFTARFIDTIQPPARGQCDYWN
jgi:hypothetical protein